MGQEFESSPGKQLIYLKGPGTLAHYYLERLMVSGSASLPEPVMRRWHSATGHWLLERYGMTEVGMALGNPLDGPRLPGRVGRPFPGVRVRLRDPDSDRLQLRAGWAESAERLDGAGDGSDCGSEVSGSLEVSGPLVFSEYFGRPADTTKEFTEDGWFRTGDTASCDLASGSFRILGRTSVDIVKSGGYKISALEVEAAFAGHSSVAECAVLGVPDETWGERLVLVAVPALGQPPAELGELQTWAADRLAKYKWPRELRVVQSLPRNAMGKVNKKQLRLLVLAEKST